MKILIFAPHCDDAEIGMGGTIAYYAAQGHDIKLINVLISGKDFIYPDTKDFEYSKKSYNSRIKSAQNSARLLGIEMEFLDLDPDDFTFNRKNIEIFDKIVLDYKPDKIFTVWKHDSHNDHHSLSRIVISISRKNTASLYMFETMLPGGIVPESFNPQLYVNISDFIDIKRKSIEAYDKALSKNNIEAVIQRSAFRGQQIGVSYAESFEIVKEIIN